MRRFTLLAALAVAVVTALLPGVSHAGAPTSGTAAINGGAAYTNTTAVTVNVTAKHCQESNDQWKMNQVDVKARNGSSGDFVAVTLLSSWNDNSTGCAAGAPKANSFAWTLPSGDGAKTVEVRFFHGDDYVSASDTIVLDTVPPFVTITSPATGTTAAGTTVDLVFTATDAGGGVVSARATLGSATYAATRTSGTAASGTWTVTGVPLACGSNTIGASATDDAGNVGVAAATIAVTRTSGCVSPPTGDGTKDAPAVANAYLKTHPALVAECKVTYGKSWHGKVISQVARHFQGVPFTEASVASYIAGIC